MYYNDAIPTSDVLVASNDVGRTGNR